MAGEDMRVRFPRQPRRGVIMGFTGPRLAAGIAAILTVTAGFIVGSTGTLVTTIVIAALLIASVFVRIKGRPVIEWAPLWVHWKVRGATKQTRFRAIVTKRRAAGMLALPGSAARLRLVLSADDVAYIHDPELATLTAALRVEHPAMVLLDASAQMERVAGYSRALSALAGSPSVDHVAFLEETIPDTGNGTLEWWKAHWTGKDDWASREYFALLTQSQFQSSIHRTTANLTVKVGRRGLGDAAINLAAQRRGFEESLASAGLRVKGWLGESELAQQIRQAYAPFSTPSVQHLSSAGPVAIDESWGSVRHDDGFSCVLALYEFPAVPVNAQFLHSLLFSAGVRHTFTLIVKVQPIDEALRKAKRDKMSNKADRDQKAKWGQVEDMSDETELGAIRAREAALLQGHAAVDLTALITIMASTQDELEGAVAQVKRDAGRCACEAGVLYSMQSAAFIAAALPVGRSI